MDSKKAIGNRINSALALREMKQKELANSLGVTANTISYFCSGSRSPNLIQIIQISKTLNVTTDYLLGLSDDPSPTPSAVDELGLSNRIIGWLIHIKEMLNKDMADDIYRILENCKFHELIYQIHYYISAKKAVKIYQDVLESFYSIGDYESKSLEDIENIDINFHKKIKEVATSGEYSRSVSDAIIAQMKMGDNFSVSILEEVGFGRTNPTGIKVSEIAAFNVNRAMEQLLDIITVDPIKSRNKPRGWQNGND